MPVISNVSFASRLAATGYCDPGPVRAVMLRRTFTRGVAGVGESVAVSAGVCVGVEVLVGVSLGVEVGVLVAVGASRVA